MKLPNFQLIKHSNIDEGLKETQETIQWLLCYLLFADMTLFKSALMQQMILELWERNEMNTN